MKTALNKDQKIARLEAQLAHQSALIEQLKEVIILGRYQRFSKASESLRSLQSDLFDEAEIGVLACEQELEPEHEADTVEIPAHTRKRNGRQSLPADLPRIDKVYDLDEQEKVCAQGHAMTYFGDKVSEQLDIIPMQIQVIRHIRKQYHCPCCNKVGNTQIKTADKPKQPIEKSMASPGLLAHIAMGKYADSLPLYRQSQIFKRIDIELNRTTMANWMVRCGKLIQPLINRLDETLLSQPVLHMDETPVQVLDEAGKPATSHSYMWVRSGAPPNQPKARIVLFDYDPSRSSNVPVSLLEGFEGALMVDGYAGYDAVVSSQTIQRLGCWAHARRKFVEAGKANKKNNGQAGKVIKLIAKLYKLEKAIKDANASTRYHERQSKAKPIISELHQWLIDYQPKVPPKTALGKAITYLANQWPSLIKYLEDGRYPIDNNLVENAIRPFAVGRKNWLFSKSVAGAKASANLYSLIETAKAHELKPYDYLAHVFAQLPNAQCIEDIDTLLPWAELQGRR